MRIAQVAPLVERVPPKKYGGSERVVAALTNELVKRGHDVTLFASGDSPTKAKLDAVTPICLREARVRPLLYGTGVNLQVLQQLGRVYGSKDRFDIIHDHTEVAGLPFAQLSDIPSIFTLHSHTQKDHMPIYEEFSKAKIVGISKDESTDIDMFPNYYGFVHNGLEMEDYPFSAEHDGYLLNVGRINQEKGTHNAIMVAKKLNLPLIIAAKIDDNERGYRYFKKYVEPHLGGDIKWVGEVDETERNRLMSRAMCFLHPGTWREPFGLTLIEAPACGAPVIAYGRGAIPEVVKDGVSGYVVHDIDSMAEAILKVKDGKIDRAGARKHVLDNFSASKMADGYEALYKKLLGQS